MMSRSESMRRRGSYIKEKKRLFKECNYTCQICGFSIQDQIEALELIEKPTASEDLNQYYIYRSKVLNQMQSHHIQPLSKNGKNGKSNLTIVCDECHKKLHREEDEKELEKTHGKNRGAKTVVSLKKKKAIGEE
jgi:5-methylcytosine-specific restriction endonuclease McrA